MGFNLIRWVSNPQYRALRRWRAIRGDETLRLDYPLGPSAVVIDAGAHLGDFAAQISERFGCVIHAFEPVPEFATHLRGRQFFRPVVVYECGLSDCDGAGDIALAADGTSLFGAGARLRVQFRDAATVVESFAPKIVDLMKLNVEGSEYEILDRLISSGRISAVANVQVQFHLIRGDDGSRYRRIARLLRRTHDLTWRFPFVWENWRLRA